jgi:hypothetical protein
VTIDVQKAVQDFAQEVQDLLDSVLPRPDDVPPDDRKVQVPFIDGRYSVRVVLPGTSAVLAEGRERWRRRQIGMLVRDAPAEAVRVLRELGYDIRPPATGEHRPNLMALRRW